VTRADADASSAAAAAAAAEEEAEEAEQAEQAAAWALPRERRGEEGMGRRTVSLIRIRRSMRSIFIRVIAQRCTIIIHR
jgi:hypothetical protein